MMRVKTSNFLNNEAHAFLIPDSYYYPLRSFLVNHDSKQGTVLVTIQMNFLKKSYSYLIPLVMIDALFGFLDRVIQKEKNK